LWRHSRSVANPVFDVSILSRSAFAKPSVIYWLHMIFSSGIVYSLAFFINTRPGGTAAQFGFVTLFLYGSGLLSAPAAGKLIDRIDPRLVCIVAMVASLLGTVLFLNIDVSTPLWMVIVVVCVMGFGIGINTPSMMKMALGAVPAHSMGAGSGLFSMFRDLGSPTGSSLSLAVFGATLAYQTQAVIARQTESLGLDASALAALARAAGGRVREVPQEVTDRLGASGLSADAVMLQAHSEGLNAALTNVGYLLLALIVAALALSLRLVKSTAQKSADSLATDGGRAQ